MVVGMVVVVVLVSAAVLIVVEVRTSRNSISIFIYCWKRLIAPRM